MLRVHKYVCVCVCVCIFMYVCNGMDVSCHVHRARIHAKLGKSKSDKIHEVFATRDMMVGISPPKRFWACRKLGCAVQALLRFRASVPSN